jgi:hypothetical protein
MRGASCSVIIFLPLLKTSQERKILSKSNINLVRVNSRICHACAVCKTRIRREGARIMISMRAAESVCVCCCGCTLNFYSAFPPTSSRQGHKSARRAVDISSVAHYVVYYGANVNIFALVTRQNYALSHTI